MLTVSIISFSLSKQAHHLNNAFVEDDIASVIVK